MKENDKIRKTNKKYKTKGCSQCKIDKMVENAHFTSVYRNNELGMGVIIRSVRKVVIIRPQSIIGGMVRNEI